MKYIFIQLLAAILFVNLKPIKYSFENSDIHLTYNIESQDSQLILDIQFINKGETPLFMFVFNENNIVSINDYESDKLCIAHSYQDIHLVRVPLLKLNATDTLKFKTKMNSKYVKDLRQVEFKIDYLNPYKYRLKSRNEFVEKLIKPYPYEPYFSEGYFTIDKYDYYVNCDRLNFLVPF